MMKRGILAVIAIFVVWAVLDFVIHGVLLRPLYETTADLWRPMEQMNAGLIYLVTLVSAACFVAIYSILIAEKCGRKGLIFGLLFGLATGVSMGFGTYAVMPIPFVMALTWFFGTVVEAVAAGLIVGAIMNPGPHTA